MDKITLSTLILKILKNNYSDYLIVGKSLFKIKDNNIILEEQLLSQISLNTDNDILFGDYTYEEFSLCIIAFLEIQESKLKDITEKVGKTTKNKNDVLLDRNHFIEHNFKKLINYIKPKVISTKQYFEIMPWLYNFILIVAKICVIYNIALDIYNSKFNTQSHKKRNLFKQKFEVFLNSFIKNKTICNKLLVRIIDNKLDFSGSGLILTALLTNGADLLDFSGTHKLNINDTENGYDKVLNIFKTKYKTEENFAYINSFLDLFHINIREIIKSEIISRNVVKHLNMVKGYNGTLYGSANKIKSNLLFYLKYNCYPLDDNIILTLNKMSNALAKELDDIINMICPSIEKLYIKLTSELTSQIRLKGLANKLIVPHQHIIYYINPKKSKSFEVKLSNTETNAITGKTKLARSSRRQLSYFKSNTNYKKLKSSVGADIIQGFDALVVFYIKEILQIIAPNLCVATIFDAFIFSDHISLKTFKNISRLACQLSFKNSIVAKILEVNQISSNAFYESFNHNIFDDIKNNPLQNIIESKFLTYLLKNPNIWEEPSMLCFNYSLSLLDVPEKIRYLQYIKTLLDMPELASILERNPKFFKRERKLLLNNTLDPDKLKFFMFHTSIYKDTVNKIFILEYSFKVKFVLKELESALKYLKDNFNDDFIIKGSVMETLNKIMNCDDFMK